MNEAIDALEKISQDEKIIGLYDAEKIDRKVYNTKILSARQEGIEEGKKEEKIEIARNLINENVDIEIIKKGTNLTLDEIENIKCN